MTISSVQEHPQANRRVSLRNLRDVQLDERRGRLLAAALADSGGDPMWRGRKQAEAHDVLALSQVAPEGRLEVLALELSQSLRALLAMQVPVPCRPDEHNRLRVADHALLGLTYPREALCQPLPGCAFVQILEPRGVWLPAVDENRQALCMGPSLLPGLRVTELALMTYGALSMQAVQVDQLDPAGVFSAEAARWWQQNLHRAPLCRTPFLAPDEPRVGSAEPGRSSGAAAPDTHES